MLEPAQNKGYALYASLVFDRPRLLFLITALLLGSAAYFVHDFHLDVSAESLVLENDADLDPLRDYPRFMAILDSLAD